METRIQLRNLAIDAKIKDQSLERDLEKGAEIYLHSDTRDLVVNTENSETMEEETIYSLWFQFGQYKEQAFMWDVRMDDLELFAHSILKSIEIIRRNYADEIKYQTKQGAVI